MRFQIEFSKSECVPNELKWPCIYAVSSGNHILKSYIIYRWLNEWGLFQNGWWFDLGDDQYTEEIMTLKLQQIVLAR